MSTKKQKKKTLKSKPSQTLKDERTKIPPFFNFHILMVAIIISFITFLIYVPALQNNFVNLDDHTYVVDNTHIRSLDFKLLEWSFGFFASNWHPLTWLSHATDYALWGLNAQGHHLTNVIIHSLNTFLLFIFIVSLLFSVKFHENQFIAEKNGILSKGIIVGGITALLFGIHPVHVESVAWISERKDVLSTFFFLLSLIFYVRYVRGEQTGRKRNTNYGACLLSFAFALMSKPMAVTLPIILFILDMYPFQRFSFRGGIHAQKKILIEKIPFFFLSLISFILTLSAQLYGGAVKTVESYPLAGRFIIAIKGLCFYILKMIFPVTLSPYYPYPKDISLLSLEYATPPIVVMIVTLLCLWAWKRGRKVFVALWASYVVTLLPVLGIIQIGGQAAADRYTYIPSISPFLLAGLSVAFLWKKIEQKGHFFKAKMVLVLLPLIVVFVLLGGLTVKQIGMWKDSVTLWTSAIKVFPDHENFYMYRAGAFEKLGNDEKASEDLKKAIALNPDNAEAYDSLGGHDFKKGDYQSALIHYTKAIEVDPKYYDSYNNRATTYLLLGDIKKGLKDLERAIELNTNFFAARLNQCQAYNLLKNYQQAIEACSNALTIKPEDDISLRPHKAYFINLAQHIKKDIKYEVAYFNRAMAYYNIGEKVKAVQDFDRAISLNPKFMEAYYTRGVILYELGNFKKALADFSKTISLNPKFSDAYYNQASTYLKVGKKKEALSNYRKAARLGNKNAQEFLNEKGLTW